MFGYTFNSVLKNQMNCIENLIGFARFQKIP